MTDPRPHEQPWLDLPEAAAMTGLDREAVQALVRRGLIPHRVDDQGRRLVQIPPGSVTADDRARSAASNAVLGEEVTGLREELARASDERAAAERAAEGETARLREELDRARDRADRLEGELRAALDEVRRP
jgi:hypothetical protein